MGIQSPFEESKERRQQHLKEHGPVDPAVAVPQASSAERRGAIQLPKPKKKGKGYNLYLEVELMERVSSLAESQGIPVSQVVSVLLRSALDQMEGGS